MDFTREQLEKIISEAPEGAAHYSDKTYVIINNGDTEWCQIWFAGIWGKNYYIHNAYSLTDLAEKLQEMKSVKEVKEVNNLTREQIELIFESIGERRSVGGVVEFDFNNPGDWLWGASSGCMGSSKPHYCIKTLRAMLDKMKMNDSQDMQSVDENIIEWKRGDECLYRGHEGIVIEWHPEYPVIVIDTSEYGIECAQYRELSKPLTPEQKQQKIDEQNGELLFNMEDKLWNDLLNCDASCWSEASEESQKVYIELAKQVSFKGKLESI